MEHSAGRDFFCFLRNPTDLRLTYYMDFVNILLKEPHGKRS